MTDTASATVLIQVSIGEKGLEGLLGNGLQLPFEKHAVTVQVTLDPEIKAKLAKALALLKGPPTTPKVRDKKSR